MRKYGIYVSKSNYVGEDAIIFPATLVPPALYSSVQVQS